MVRNFGNDDLLAALASLFDSGFGPHDDSSLAGGVGLNDFFSVVDFARSGKVGAFDELGQVFNRHIRIDGKFCSLFLVPDNLNLVDHKRQGVNNFVKVVWGDVGRHGDGDAGHAVANQVWEKGGQNGWLLAGAVVGEAVINRFLIQVFEQ